MSAIVNFIGHSTVHLDMDGIRLLTDQLLKPLVDHLRRQVPALDPSLLDVDVVLISHLHGDHLDLPSLEQIGRDTHLIVPRGASSFLKLRRFRNVQEIEAGESVDVGNVRVGWKGLDATREELELVEIVQLSPSALAEAREAALELEARAYKISKEVYDQTPPSQVQ